nr:hypothetical protein BaRGS_020636 [Batillaria attramentaria]
MVKPPAVQTGSVKVKLLFFVVVIAIVVVAGRAASEIPEIPDGPDTLLCVVLSTPRGFVLLFVLSADDGGDL